MKSTWLGFVLLFVMTMVTTVSISSDGAPTTKTAYGGALLVEDLAVTPFTFNSEISHIVIYSLYEGSDGTIITTSLVPGKDMFYGYKESNSHYCFADNSNTSYIYDSSGDKFSVFLAGIGLKYKLRSDNLDPIVAAAEVLYSSASYKPIDGYTQYYKRTEFRC